MKPLANPDDVLLPVPGEHQQTDNDAQWVEVVKLIDE
jgi:hypothetical protein